MKNWRKTSYSSGNGGACIETASSTGTVAVRDTKQAHMPARDVLTFTPASWRQFTAGLKNS